MYEEFEISGFHITTDPEFQDNRDHITPQLKWELEKMYPTIQKGNITVIRKILHLIERHPKNPQLKNFLSSAYQASGNYKKAVEVNDWILKEHPNYLFGLLNKAHQYINSGKPENVPEILGEGLDLKKLYPDRDVFHLAEVTGFFKLAVMYYAAIDDFDQADMRLDILKEVAPDHPDTETARTHLLYKKMEAGVRRFEEEEKTKIKVEAKGNYQSVQTLEKPVFHHSEMEWLYQYDSTIENNKLEKIFALPRETLIRDLQTILKDIIRRYQYFRELEEDGRLSEDENFFGCHAVYLLGDMEASESIDIILETFKQDNDFLHFWYFDLLTHDFWDPLFKMGKNQLDKLKNFVLTPHLDTYPRSEVVTAIAQIAHHYPERRNEIIKCLEEIMDSVLNSGPESGIVDSEFNGFLVWDVVELRGTELLGKIEKLYAAGYVAEGIVGPYESVKKDISGKPKYDYKKQLTSVYEKYDELNDVSSSKGIHENAFPQITEPSQPQTKQIASSPKVGRNDPCPCGSGKKYKKCCMNK